MSGNQFDHTTVLWLALLSVRLDFSNRGLCKYSLKCYISLLSPSTVGAQQWDFLIIHFTHQVSKRKRTFVVTTGCSNKRRASTTVTLALTFSRGIINPKRVQTVLASTMICSLLMGHFMYIHIHTHTIHMHILYYIHTYTYTHNGLLLNLKKEILIYLTTWITLKDILGSHTSQQQKDKDYISSYLWGISRNQTQQKQNSMVVTRVCRDRNGVLWWIQSFSSGDLFHNK